MKSRALYRIDQVAAKRLEGFRCGDPNLDQFLAEYAIAYSLAGLTQTFIMIEPDCEVPVAYFSLSTDGMPLDFVERNRLSLAFDCSLSFFPSIKITKFAVREDLQSNGIGTDLIDTIGGLAHTPNVSARLLTVDAASNPRTIAFYERNGFRTSRRHADRATMKNSRNRSAQGDSRTVHMFRDLYDPEEAHPLASRWPQPLKVEDRLSAGWSSRPTRPLTTRTPSSVWQ